MPYPLPENQWWADIKLPDLVKGWGWQILVNKKATCAALNVFTTE